MFIKLAAIAAVVPFTVQAAEIAPAFGIEHTFGSMNVLTYYVETPAGLHLVATMNRVDGSPDTIVRFIADLNDGQQVIMSMPRPIGGISREVVFRLVGNRLVVDVDEPNW